MVLKKLKAYFQKAQFSLSPIGYLLNPYYDARREIYKAISKAGRSLSKGIVLDIGCGQKPYKNLIPHTKYYGIEICGDRPLKKGVDIAYDGIRIPIADCSIDTIICTQVLEHVFRPDEFMCEINRLCKVNGSLLLTVPFFWPEHEKPFDYGRYSSFGLTYLLRINGFEIISQYKTLNDFRVICQLVSCYIEELISQKSNLTKKLIRLIITFPISIAGVVFSNVLPKSSEIYLDNVIVAKKVKQLQPRENGNEYE